MQARGCGHVGASERARTKREPGCPCAAHEERSLRTAPGSDAPRAEQCELRAGLRDGDREQQPRACAATADEAPLTR